MTETRKPNRPSHILFLVEGDNDNAVWTEIGVVWAHAKGNGFNLSLMVVPYARDARLVILSRKAKEQSTAEAGA
jgi:hypothetical protein